MNNDAIKHLYEALLGCWNVQDAKGFADVFWDDGNVVGFDGSEMQSRSEIETELGQIFSSHKTARYVWKVKEIRFLNPGTALLRAIAGMIPPGKNSINPPTNAIQSLIALQKNGTWKISLFQNTPAQFHGRPELVDAMTKELSQVAGG